MTIDAAPIERIYDLSRLSNAGDEIAVSADAAELQKLAQWFEADTVQKFEATVSLRRLAPDRYRYDAAFTCEMTRISVLSLEPVQTIITQNIQRELHVVAGGRKPAEDFAEPLSADGDDDLPEELSSPRYNLAAPLLEELSLALDPYPRGQNEVFEPPQNLDGAVESPFAILKKLKDGG